MCSTRVRLVSLPLALIAIAAISESLSAQTPLHAHFALNPGQNYFGNRSGTGLGDVDGDGVPDYAIGARGGDNIPGYVAVYSGAVGELLTTLTGTGTADPSGGSDRFGVSIAGIGDVDGDQVPDLLVGAGEDDTYGVNKGAALVFSGSDWSVLRLHAPVIGLGSFGREVGPLGDVNGDGVPEYLVVERQDYLHCFDGATGALLWTHQTHYFDFATHLSQTVGDVSGDGVPDALFGATSSFPLSGNLPHTRVLDGTDGSELYRVTSATTSFGSHVGWLGDLNGDLRSEFGVGSPVAPGGGEINVYDGASGSTVFSITGVALGVVGKRFCGMGDQNGDGIPDFAADAGGVARLYSGTDGSLIHSCDTTPFVVHADATQWLAPVGDLDGDGAQELLNSTYSLSGLSGGAVVVFSSAASVLEDLGFALGGSLGDPILTAEGSLQGGSVLQVALVNAPTSSPAVAVFGFSAIHFPLFGGTFVPSPDLVVPGSTDGSGGQEFWFPVSPGVPSQTELYLQYWILGGGGPTGFTASNAVKGIFP